MKNHGLSSIPGFLALAILFFSFLCCTVREDRDMCPSLLILTLPHIPYGAQLVSVMDDDEVLFCDTLDCAELELSAFSLSTQVPKKPLTVAVYWPYTLTSSPLEGYIPQSKCDSLWSSYQSFFPKKDGESLPMELHKNFCSLKLNLTGPSVYGQRYTLRFQSNVRGLGKDGQPLEGVYSELSYPLTDGSYEVNILRQSDYSLRMDVLEKGAEGTGGGGTIRSFAIGDYMALAGYDWSAPDLEDMEITLDFARTLVTLSTSKWAKSIELSVVI